MIDLSSLKINFQHESIQTYVIIYSLYEEVISVYKNNQVDSRVPIKKRFTEVLLEIGYDEEISKSFNELRFIRNRIIHESKTLFEFSGPQIKKIVEVFNNFVLKSALINERTKKYEIDLSIFSKIEIEVPISEYVDHPGFIIIGIDTKKNAGTEFYSIFSIIFQFFQKSELIANNAYIGIMQSKMSVDLNIFKIYKYAATILLLIKNNYLSNSTLDIKIDEADKLEAEVSLNMINYYLVIFSHLIKDEIPPIKIFNESDIVVSSTDKNADIYIKNLNKDSCKPSFIEWNESKVRYKIENDDEDLTKILQEVFGLTDFYPGQLEVIKNILNSRETSITVMPTGSGKSLIYYFVTYMQPGKSLIISPSKILIEDQIRNLKNKHNLTNTTYISTEPFNTDLCINQKIIFLTPEAVIRENILSFLINSRVENNVSFIILDEVHTLSEWSHDFRVEYFMTLNIIKTYFASNQILGFTATANLKVVDNLLKQFSISHKNVFVPIDVVNDNFNFSFDELSTFSAKHIIKKSNYRSIIFTQTETDSFSVFDLFTSLDSIDVSLFSDWYKTAYNDFVDGTTNNIISSGDLGIGIDLPNVNRVIHYGRPISISQYIQEIGRAARNGKVGLSHVYFNTESLSKTELRLLNRNLSTIDIIENLQELPEHSIFKKIHSRFVFNIDDPFTTRNRIIDLYQLFKSNNYKNSQNIIKNNPGNLKDTYTLYKIGVVSNWMITDDGSNILITLKKGFEDYNRLVQTTIDNMKSVGSPRDRLFRIRQSTNFVQLVHHYDDWYFDEYVRYHREQFINLHYFLKNNMKNNESDSSIKDVLRNYMSLSLLSNDYSHITIPELVRKLENGEFTKTSLDILLEKNYSYKLDFMSFLVSAKNNQLELDRLERISSIKSTEKCSSLLFEFIKIIYENLSEENKIKFVDYLLKYNSEKYLVTRIYAVNKKDTIYNYLMFRRFNREFLEGVL